ncbi:membrane protein [Capnocytophaga sp. HP1101]
MKKNITLSILCLVGLMFTACQKDFLNTSPTETLPDAPAQTRLNGLYLMMDQPGTGGTTNHDDFGQKSYDIYMDMLSGDMAMIQPKYGWYQDVANLEACSDYTYTINYEPWRYYYRMIYEANKSIAQLSSPQKDEEKYILAQERAMRAYAYFYLMQLFTTKYEPDSNTNSIPLYTEADVVAKGKAKQSEIYALMVQDLEFAVANLEGFERDNKGMIDKYVAKGLLAYVYGAMGETQKVADLALDIVNNSGYPLTTREQTVYDETTKKGGGFNDLNITSWMWGFDIIAENGVSLRTWWGHMDLFTYSYMAVGSIKGIDSNLLAQIRPNDIRKKQFDEQNRPTGKFFAPERKVAGQREVLTDNIFMRVDEFYLLAAEALTKLNRDTEAKAIYKRLLTLRYPEATATADVAYVDALTNTQLLDDIYLNTRIELWGEGKSYLSLKRNHRSVTRGANHYEKAGETFSYDSPQITLKIPQNEMNNNYPLANP